MNAYYQTFSEEGHLRAREVIEQAVGQDPDNSNVWAQLANVCRDEFWLGHNPLPNSLDRCLEAARRAVELDPGSEPMHRLPALIFTEAKSERSGAMQSVY